MGQESSAPVLPPAPFQAPRTSFNTALTPRRSYAFTSLDLPAAKAVKNKLGCTVNDIVLALCGGALRRYLEACGEEVDSSLVAMVPMSVRTTDDAGGVGNKVTMMLCALRSEEHTSELQSLMRISYAVLCLK